MTASEENLMNNISPRFTRKALSSFLRLFLVVPFAAAASRANDIAMKVVLDAAGDVIITGNSYLSTTREDMLTIKYSATNGAMVWLHRYSGAGNRNDWAREVAVDKDGNVVVTASAGFLRDSVQTNSYVAKYAASDGALLWEKDYTNGAASALALDNSGNVVVAGVSYQSGAWEYYTAKHAGVGGSVLWEKRGPNGFSANAVAVDEKDNVVVIGHSATIKYASDGTLLWEKSMEGVSGIALEFDLNGNILVTGSIGYPFDDYYTAKLAALDGALVWEKRYNGPANKVDYARGIAVDAAGNVVVTGSSANGSYYDYYTVKYAAESGAIVWEKRDINGEASAVTMDCSGNPIVTGSANGGEFYLAKYGASDGALHWGKRRPDAWGSALVIHGCQFAGVTGFQGDAWADDAGYYTARFEAVDGTLLWEKTYSGTAPPLVGIATSVLSVPEFGSEARVEVRRTGNLETTVTIRYSAAPWNGAISGQDYTDVSGILTFPPGKESDFIRVPILNDTVPEPLEGVQITLSNPSVGVALGLSSTIVKIIDNDKRLAAGPLIVTVSGPIYRDWERPNLQWGYGYPTVNVRFDLDEGIGRQRQIIADNEIVRGSNMNDQPDFISNYSGNLRVNFLAADFGQAKIIYDFAFPTQLFDLMVLDVEEDDHIRIECRKPDGTPIDPRLLQLVMQGDLSRNYNAPDRPPSEAATPPVWDPVAGTLSAAVTWNENRSYTVLRPSVPVASITLTFAGNRTGAHIYAGLWARPPALALIENRHVQGESHLRWTSLPGISYRVMQSSNLIDWVQGWTGMGTAAPELTTQAIIPSLEQRSSQFFKVEQW